jgi:hypothetical protein
MTFNAVSAVWAPFITTVDYKSNLITGFYADIWKLLETRMNFTTKIIKPTPSASWSSLVQMVHNGNVQFAITGFSLTTERYVSQGLSTVFSLF